MSDRVGTERVVGIETEFGCLVSDESLGRPEDVVEAIKDHLFFDKRIGVIDYHARDDVFEPAQSGGFLLNGSRLYVDAVGSHLEYATAECISLKDLVANDRAGQRMIVSAIKSLGLQNYVNIYNNSIDHFGGHTFGCHENYHVRAEGELLNGNLHFLIPFLVTRQIFAGVGRVGGHILFEGGEPSYAQMNENPVDYIWVSNVYSVMPDDSVEFQLCQRADHILKTIASRVRFNRAIINPKWETMYTTNGMTRLHILFGESNQNQYAYALKVGTTQMAIRACEDGLITVEQLLAYPLEALRSISRDSTYRWECQTVTGVPTTAIEIQRQFHEACEVYAEESEQAHWVWTEWKRTLDDLENDPMKMGDRLDWVLKKQICEQYIEAESTNWQDDALQSVDLEYHNIDPAQSLFYGVETERVCKESDIAIAQVEAPKDTRAFGRSKLVRHVMKRKGAPIYAFDWNAVQVDRAKYVTLEDPLDPYLNPLDQWGNPIFADSKNVD